MIPQHPIPRFVIDGQLTAFTDGTLPDGFTRIIGPPYVIETGPVEPGTRLATEADLAPISGGFPSDTCSNCRGPNVGGNWADLCALCSAEMDNLVHTIDEEES